MYQPDLEIQEFWRTWKHESLDWVRHHVPKIVIVIALSFLLVQFLWMITNRLTRFADREIEPGSRRHQQLRTLCTVIKSVGLAVILFWASIETLQEIGINIGPLLASAGIAGLAIGFGAQTLVKDVINGFFILIENQYDLGDTIRVGGVKGTVEAMTLRRTVLRDADGSVHIVPNSEIHIVTNSTRDWTQVSLHVAVAYKEPSERIISLLQQIGRELRAEPNFVEAIVADPEVPGIERVTANEVDYLMLVKTRPADQFRVTRELRRRIKECFEKHKIEPARPAQLYVVDKPESETPK